MVSFAQTQSWWLKNDGDGMIRTVSTYASLRKQYIIYMRWSLFAFFFFIASSGFWQLGKTELAKAYVIPTLVAGILLLIIGVGLVYANTQRISEFETAYHEDKKAFINSEFNRIDRTLKEYQTIVFKAIPIIMMVAALLIILTDKPFWRAISITTIAMMIVILLIDGTAHSRIVNYKNQLEILSK